MPRPSANQFSGIFVSYRRDDSSSDAGRLVDRLVAHFRKDLIFMDIHTIEPGEDFVMVIENAVGSCEILIALIGRHWLSRVGETVRLLDNPKDFVRLEIATALKRDIRVIPVLVQRASMPKPEDLPDDMKNFSRRNYIELSDLHWHDDVDKLITVMDRVLAEREEARLAEAARQAELERQHREEQETQRVEEQRVRLSEEEAMRRPPEERRLQEEKESKEAEERARLEGQEASRRLAEEERVRADTEAGRRAEEEIAEKAKCQPGAEQSLQASHEEKPVKPDLLALPTTRTSGAEAQLSGSHALGDIRDSTLLRADKGKRTMLLIIIASVAVAVLAIVAVIWTRRTPRDEQSANPSPSTEQRQTTSASPTRTIPQPSPNGAYMPRGTANVGRDDGDEAVRNADNSNNANTAAPSTTNTPILTSPAEGSKTYSLPAWVRDYPVGRVTKSNPDTEILLPEDFKKLEGEPLYAVRGLRLPPSILGQEETAPNKPLNTSGSFPEISDKRKVFVNFTGPVGDRITTRLRAYGLEIVKTATEAEFAVNYYSWSREEVLYNPSRPWWEKESKKTVEGGTMIITTRDPSQQIPRILWRNDDTDGGMFKRGDAFDKLTKRFISELKKLRGEK